MEQENAVVIFVKRGNGTAARWEAASRSGGKVLGWGWGFGPGKLTFEGEANPRSRLQAGTSADTQGQQEEPGSRCCHGNSHAGSPQRTKSGQKKKKEVEAAEEWTIITERPMRNKRDKKREKTGETLRLSLISLIRSLACSLSGQTQRTQNHVQNFTPALENMTGLLFI